MSTNFYWDEPDATGDRKHIGKRSGAGAYCWTCKRTMCIDGEKVRKLAFAEIVDSFTLEALAKELLRWLSMSSNELEIITY